MADRMDNILQTGINPGTVFHYERSRLNNLFMEAVNYPLVLVCAGAGYGKTRAVYDFSQKYQAETVWIQLSERDNQGSRFWENFTYTTGQLNESFAKALQNLEFPDTIDKLNQFFILMRSHVEMKRRIIVMDDFHLIEDPQVIHFVEYTFLNLPPGNTLILISRSGPRINTAGMMSRGYIFNIGEEELRFNDSELALYFRQLDITLQTESFYKIMKDTEGWAFAIDLIARLYRQLLQKPGSPLRQAPGYEGYLSNAMKANIFRLMETEIWNGISAKLKIFLVQLSLAGQLSVDLIVLLAKGDNALLAELDRQNAYVRCDLYINAYLIHHLFLEFLAAKQDMLSEDQKKETYVIAGEWCRKNGFKIDAMTYYEKTGDYKSMTELFNGMPPQIPLDMARYSAEIFKRAPPIAFDNVLYLASIHIRSLMSQGLWEETIHLAGYYEMRFRKLPLTDRLRALSLSSIYYYWGIARSIMCLTDDTYDFDQYFEKCDKCFTRPCDPGTLINRNPGGPWLCMAGTSRKGAPDEFLAAMLRSSSFLMHCYTGFESGKDQLAFAELAFYRNNIRAAEEYLAESLDIARKNGQFGVIQRALFYTLRIAFLQGNYANAELALKNMKVNLQETGYFNRFMDYDISLCWYYCALGAPEKTPDWLKDDFLPYAHAGFIENFSNQFKACYCYAARNYFPLLSYMQDMKQRESYLFGKVVMLAMEACIHYKRKDRMKACMILTEAYRTAFPNEITMPFIELGKDMRSLTAFMLREPDLEIPREWLTDINRKAATYSKRQAHIISEYRQASGLANGIFITPREREVLTDLAYGLSRSEIASGMGLSINTVKMIISSIYSKIGAERMTDAVRIAIERKLI
ncbi:MAG: LuxR C-terminal-related transcriptional regulator [Treponema sp.]|nr:LuxR C-terminal-related transcriptional regulator [Treponema sp.]